MKHFFNRMLSCQFFLVCTTMLLVLSACSNDMPPDVSYHKENQLQSAAVTDAIRMANQLMSEFDGETRGVIGRSVKSVESIWSGTRLENDPLFYIVNYDNDGGYVMLSTRDKQNPLYAISSEGHLSESDTVGNGGLKMFFDDAIAYTGSLALPSNPSFQNTVDTVYDVKLVHKVNPRVTLIPRKWHQGYPYNKYCYNFPVGCGAVALATTMSYYKWPEQYNDVDESKIKVFDWEWLTSQEDSDDTAALFKTLGNSNLLSIVYSSSGSSCNPNDISRAFKNLGYGFTNNLYESSLNWEYSIAIDLIRGVNGYNPHVLLCCGYEKKVGHTWVIDGEYTYSVTPIYQTVRGIVIGKGETTLQPALLHCCWGWGGSCNGYYRFNLETNQIDNNSVRPTEENPDNDCIGYHFGYILFWAPKKM